jgi:cytoplasmic iron level regulating protein YaaA (DUF328/UPF0246 family)
MLFVLSPAKTLDFTPAPVGLAVTQPEMRPETARLAATARKLRAADLKRLMGISDKLAELNVARFKGFRIRGEAEGVPAALAFAGDVYTGLKARELDENALAWAQDHLRILSGLYGLLRPLDVIQPYRLEMGVRLATERGHTLYDFWGDRISKALNKAARGQADRTLVNLASQEYFGAVDALALKLPVVTCQFLEEKDGEARVLSFYAKAARGMMARYAIDNRVEAPEGLKDFDRAGYSFRPERSTDAEWVFARPQPPPIAGRTARSEDDE